MEPAELEDAIPGSMRKPEWRHETAGRERGRERHARLYDKRKFRITLKQWRMLHAVVECEGFSAAAEYLHISQSAISYTIAKMQEQLGIPLLRIEGRKAQVTEQGRALLQHSRNVIRSAAELESLAEKMRLGWEPELRLMVNQDCPQSFLMAAIREFSASVPGVRIVLLEGSDNESKQALAGNDIDLAICAEAPPGQIAGKLVSVEYFAVAHPEHKLARMPGPLGAADLARHTCIVVDGHARAGAKPGGHGRHAWRFSSIDSALAALEHCLGYAWLPRERVQHSLDAGSLRRLALADGHYTTRDFYLLHAPAAAPGAGVARLAGLLHAHAALRAAIV
jgi:DNA-binding transcriptional LysR family regulator